MKERMKKTVCILLVAVFCLSSAPMLPAFVLQGTAASEQSNYFYGDIDGDGGISSDDARMALRAAVDLETLSEEERFAADVDGDGIISPEDARWILRVSAGLDNWNVQPAPPEQLPPSQTLLNGKTIIESDWTLDNNNRIAIKLFFEDCVNLTSYYLTLNYDSSMFEFGTSSPGADAKAIANYCYFNSFTTERNPSIAGIIKCGGYFKETLWTADKFFENSYYGDCIVDSEKFHLQTIYLTVRNPAQFEMQKAAIDVNGNLTFKLPDGSYKTIQTKTYTGNNSGDESSDIKENLENVLGLDYIFTYNDNYFAKSSYVYNHDLAIMSNCLAISAMVDEVYYDIYKEVYKDSESSAAGDFILAGEQQEDLSDLINRIRSYAALKSEDKMTEQEKTDKKAAWEKIINTIQINNFSKNKVLMACLTAGEFFEDIGFSNSVHYNYMNIPQTDSIACVIASKKIGATTVIAIGVRGAGYGAEWGGNFNVGKDEEHKGFRLAKENVLKYLSEYIQNNNISGDVKFWISGYSRAAATSNLVAATLDDGATAYSAIAALDYGPEDVYAYTFETPIPTRDKNTKDPIYYNIFNIINRVDYVPLVAPQTWGYSRYGVDCFLPSPETYADKEYGKLFEKMKTQYKQITGKNYSKKSFMFYDAKFSVKTNGFLNTGFDVSFVVPNGNISQSRYLDELITIVADYILKDVNTYVDNYQSTIQKLMVSLLGGGFEGVTIPENTETEIKNAIFEGLKAKILNPNSDTWRSTLATVISTIDGINLTYVDVYNCLGILDDAFVTGLTSYNYFYTLIENGSIIKPAHYPEINFAWIVAMEDGKLYSKVDGKNCYRVIKYNCPINIKLFDEENNLLAEIVDDQVAIAEDCYLSIYIDADGQKCFCLPEDTQYRFEITGTDDGTMNCSVSEFDFSKGEDIQTVNYYDIPVLKEEQFVADIAPVQADGETIESLADAIVLKNEDDEIIEPDEVVDDPAIKFAVTVQADSENSIVVGGGIYKKGEFAKVEAFAGANEVFAGWFTNDVLVSSETTYRFMPENDCTITAHWEPYCSVNGHTEEVILAKAATCTTTGLTEGKKCTVCGEVTVAQTEIAKLAHSKVTVNQKAATATEDGYTGDVVCSVCGTESSKGKVIPATGVQDNNCDHLCHKDGFVGFIWSIVQFFWKLFGMNPVCECGAAHY